MNRFALAQLKHLNEIKISEHFYLIEFESPDTHEVMLDFRLLIRLEMVRDCALSPIIIRSGYRTPEHNTSIPGAAKNSYHLKGMAADISCKKLTFSELLSIVTRCGFNGIIVHNKHQYIHVDVRAKKYYEVAD